MRKIVFLDAQTVGKVDLAAYFSNLGDFTSFEHTTEAQLAERIETAEIVIVNKTVLNAAALKVAKNLKLICVAATGTSNIDLDTAKQLGITVKNVKDYSTESVAQQTFALMLSLKNHVCFFDQYVKAADGYRKSKIFTSFLKEVEEIHGNVLGIIGLGSIGKRVAEIARVFGAEVQYFSASGKTKSDQYRSVSLEELLQTSDIVSIHAPLNKYTRHLLTYEKIVQMKPEALLINTGRGGIVDEAGLARALDEGLLAGAALDVFEAEPIQETNPLLNLKDPSKLLLSPHIAWIGNKARKILLEGVYTNISTYLIGE